MLKSAAKLLNFKPSNGLTLSLRSLSICNPKLEVYSDKVLKPSPLPFTYWTDTDPKRVGKEFRAAPSSNTYSSFFNKEAQKFERMLMKKGRGYLAQRLMQTALENIKLEQVEKYHKTEGEEKENIEVWVVVFLDYNNI